MNNTLQFAHRGIDALDLLGLWIGLLSLRLSLDAWVRKVGLSNPN
jgi:hypothetical protein